MCPVYFSIYEVKLDDKCGTIIIDFWDKPYQEMDFKSHSNSVAFCKYGKILSDLQVPHLILFNFTCLCSPLLRNWKM